MIYNYKIKRQIVTSTIGKDELATLVSQAASNIKTVLGIINNAAWASVLEAMDHIRQHPNYRHQAKAAFHQSLKSLTAYENRLLHARENRLFCLLDLTPEYRKQFGNITDREYYDFWASTGSSAYQREHVWITSLWNKFRLSLIAQKIPHPDIVAWGLTAQSMLVLASSVYEGSLKAYETEMEIPQLLSDAIFHDLNLKEVEQRWERAMGLLSRIPSNQELSQTEQGNIRVGLIQLLEKLTDLATISDSIAESVSAYEEVFRTPGEQDKALRKAKQLKEDE